MQNWASHAPMNYKHKFDLVEAERYRISGEHVKARVKDLEKRYPHLLPALDAGRVFGAPSEKLDLTTIMKAAQAISSEIVLQDLLVSLMRIVIENAGAQHGYLLLEKEGELVIEAEGSIDCKEVTVLQSIPLDQDLLPRSIIHYVHRTGKSVVLGDAAIEDGFASDPYIQTTGPRSVLCMPLMKRKQLVGGVYLENNLSTNAFTKDRIDVLEMLSSQVAISLENATFFQELEQAKETLREERDRLTSVFEAMEDGVYIVSQDYDIEYVNPVLTAEFGPPDGRKCYAYFHDREAVCSWCKNQDVFAGKTVRWEWYSGKNDRTYDLIDTPLRNADGTISKLEIFRDITERKRAEQEREHARIFMQSVIDGSPDQMMLIDRDYHILLVHRAVRDMLGGKDPVSGCLTCYQVSHHRDIPCRGVEHPCPLERVIATEAPVAVTHTHYDAEDNVVYSEVSAAPIFDEAGEVIQIIESSRDITERMRAGAEREALIAELEARNAELERFIYTVSHDLKSPLITIRGFLGFVEQAAIAGNIERVQADMVRISDATDKMQQLLGELLELSRIGRLVNPPEEVSLGELAREAVEMVRGRLEERGVEVEIAPDLLRTADGPTVYGDRPRLLEVLQNLVDNAVKFTGDQPHPRVEIGVRRDGEETVFYVRDNGIGIEPRYHEKVFELFDKLEQQTEGTGVGLAIVKRIVEVHGGRVWVESEGTGQGSTFCFTLPDKSLSEK